MRGRNRPYRLKYLWLVMVGAEGFEPPTLCSPVRLSAEVTENGRLRALWLGPSSMDGAGGSSYSVKYFVFGPFLITANRF
jgi:hypothetical protein